MTNRSIRPLVGISLGSGESDDIACLTQIVLGHLLQTYLFLSTFISGKNIGLRPSVGPPRAAFYRGKRGGAFLRKLVREGLEEEGSGAAGL